MTMVGFSLWSIILFNNSLQYNPLQVSTKYTTYKIDFQINCEENFWPEDRLFYKQIQQVCPQVVLGSEYCQVYPRVVFRGGYLP